MALLFPNLTGQAGIYHISTPNYVDVNNTLTPLTEMQTFATTAALQAWSNGDMLSVNIKKDASNYKVWLGIWRPTTETIEVLIEEVSIGNINDDDSITVTATLSTMGMKNLLPFQPLIEINTSTYTLTDIEWGQTIVCTNSAALVITLSDTCSVGFHCRIIRENSTVTLTRTGFDTINAGTANVAVSGIYKHAFIYKRLTGAWIAIV